MIERKCLISTTLRLVVVFVTEKTSTQPQRARPARGLIAARCGTSCSSCPRTFAYVVLQIQTYTQHILRYFLRRWRRVHMQCVAQFSEKRGEFDFSSGLCPLDIHLRDR